jgi:hypothetical protein
VLLAKLNVLNVVYGRLHLHVVTSTFAEFMKSRHFVLITAFTQKNTIIAIVDEPVLQSHLDAI